MNSGRLYFPYLLLFSAVFFSRFYMFSVCLWFSMFAHFFLFFFIVVVYLGWGCTWHLISKSVQSFYRFFFVSMSTVSPEIHHNKAIWKDTKAREEKNASDLCRLLPLGETQEFISHRKLNGESNYICYCFLCWNRYVYLIFFSNYSGTFGLYEFVFVCVFKNLCRNWYIFFLVQSAFYSMDTLNGVLYNKCICDWSMDFAVVGVLYVRARTSDSPLPRTWSNDFHKSSPGP